MVSAFNLVTRDRLSMMCRMVLTKSVRKSERARRKQNAYNAEYALDQKESEGMPGTEPE